MISKLFGKEDEFVWRDVFFKEDFTVDKFLSKNTNKSDLVSLRQGLKKYGTDLHKCMSEILKNETEAIVNLAEALSNLTSKIDDLSKPASQLQEEIRALYEAIKLAKENFDEHMKKAKAINDKRDFLNINCKVIATCISVENILDKNLRNGEIDLLLLERAVNEYSFQKTYSQCRGFNFLQNESVMVIERKLNKVLDDSFISAVKKNDEYKIERCLRMYVNLKRQYEAENVYRDKFVHTPLSEIFSQRNFENKSQQLNVLYDQAFQFLIKNMTAILGIVKRNNDLVGYNFVLNSFWKEVDRLLRDNLPYITAPGNPELFQKRFKDTWRFLEEISAKCEDPEMVIIEDSFQDHIKRYNLPVYFEICFQQIAGRLEKELLLNFGIELELKTRDATEEFKLKVTNTFWKCFQECFRQDIFIDHLTNQFVRLSMLLLSRYLKWLEGILEKSSKSDSAYKVEEFIILSLVDLEKVRSRLEINGTVNGSVYKVLHEDMRSAIPLLIKSNNTSISETSLKFQENLIQLKLQECLEKLHDVTSVPRLYRRTNRSVPTDPSNYIIAAVDPIIRFNNSYESLLKGKFNIISDTLITKMSENFLTLVQEVLHSVGKTEKSLQRLKNRNMNISKDSSGPVTSDLNSDEGKIREQIRLDVEYFINKLQHLTFESGKKAIAKLTNELKSTS